MTTTITDNDTSTVSVAATTDADETGPVSGLFTVSLSNPSATDTVVDYTLSGTSTAGSDFSAVSGQVTILAGATSATISIPTLDDGLIEGTESVSITLDAISSGDPAVTLGGTTAASLNISDNDSASWTLTGDASVAEGGSASYAVSLTGSYQGGESAAVDVTLADVDTTSSDYADFSTAIDNAILAYVGAGSYAWDGTTLSWTATSDGDSPSVLNISLDAVDDSLVEASEDFTVTLSNAGSTTGAAITLGATTSVTTTITDNDTSTVSIAATTDAKRRVLCPVCLRFR